MRCFIYPILICIAFASTAYASPEIAELENQVQTLKQKIESLESLVAGLVAAKGVQPEVARTSGRGENNSPRAAPEDSGQDQHANLEVEEQASVGELAA